MTRRLFVLGAVTVGLAGLASQSPIANAAPPKLYLFVHDNGATNQIHRYQVSPLGTLITTQGSPINTLNTNGQCGGDCQTMAYSARRKLLFSGGGTGITVTDLSTEPPTVIGGSPFGGVRFLGVVVVEKGRNTFVYGADVNNNQIRGFRVTTTKTLEQLPSSPYPAGDEPVGMSSIRDLVFAANEDGETASSISAYKVSVDGSLVAAPGSPLTLPADMFAYNVDVDPQGRFLYSADCDNNRIAAHKINNRTAALTPVTGSPFPVPTDTVCSGLAFVSPALLFAVDDSTAASNIQALRKKPNGTLATLGGLQNSVSASPDTVAADPSGRFIAIADDSAETVQLFGVNKRTGVLTPGTPVNVTQASTNAMLFIRR